MKLFLLLIFPFSFINFSNTRLEKSFLIEKNIHTRWDIQLKKYVSDDGKVNYKDWINQIEDLKNYIENLKKFIPNENWTKNENLSYWINAYNAITVFLILENYPIESIKKLRDPWGKKIFNLKNKYYSLSEIEHDILRKINEPRIHFAINCASNSCPKLLNEAYNSQNIENQLNKVSESFINNPKKNKIFNTTAELSKIFLWYSSDFGSKEQRLEFINKYSKIKITSSTKIKYLSYDWSLNE